MGKERMNAQGVAALRRLHRKKPELSTRELAAVFGTSSPSVSYWLNQAEHLPGEHARKAPRMGAGKKTAMTLRRARVARLAAEMVLTEDTEYPANPSAGGICDELCRRFGTVVCAQTIRNDLHAKGVVCKVRSKVPLVRYNNYSQRWEFSKSVRRLRMRSDMVIFSDEKIFESNDNDCRTSWVPASADPHLREKSRWPHRIMVWGAVGKNFKMLVVMNNDMAAKAGGATRRGINSEDYINDVLRPFIAERRRQGASHKWFQQDGAAIHTSKATRAFLEESGLETFRWPAKSPDLNPIERVWAHVQKAVGKMHPLTPKELVTAVKKAWKEMPQTTVNAIVANFDDRVEKVRKLQGRWNDTPRSYAPRKHQ